MPSAPCSRRARVLCAALVIAAPAAGVHAQVPPVHRAWSFTANATTAGDQGAPDVALHPDGRFVVVWTSPDGSGAGVYGRRFDVRARPVGLEFRVNAATTGDQAGPAIASDPRRGFVVSWQSDGADGDRDAVVLRRYDAGGAPIGGELLVNTFTTGMQSRPAIAMDAAGRFVVAWESEGGDGSARGVSGRRFDARGDPVGAEFVVNSATTGDQVTPSIAMPPSGGFVVAWASAGAEIVAQRFSADGARIGGELRVNAGTGVGAADPDVSAAADGAFVVVWRDTVAGLPRIAGRAFDASGSPLGPELTVHAFTITGTFAPSVAADHTARFVVTWDDRNGVDPGYGVAARVMEADGTPAGAEFGVNFITSGDQRSPAVASDPIGNFVVAYASEDAYSVGADVRGQTFGALFGARSRPDFGPSSSSDGNGVLEPGESAEFVRSWRSESYWSSSGAMFARLTSFTGPSGATYTFDPAPEGYLPPFGGPGDEGECNGCAFIGVSGGPRPVPHWDAVATEQVEEADQHHRQRWTIHIGDSFADVPRSSPFYRFVEALLHHGVTAGCGGGSYCPLGSTTRAQMAVFVLVAKEGPAYVPPACGATPAFLDVPPSDPFCRWIEELARRGVAGGCGGGNYCPAFAVTREQMPVFVLRALDPALNPAACATPAFADVPPTSPFCRWIRELATRGVVAGCGNGLYCPLDPVSREQMGVFIGATFALALYGP